MTSSQSTIATDHASKYLQQLCKHFGHKVPVTFSETGGKIELPFGACVLVATSSGLTMTATADAADLSKLERVMGDHLTRFAFRENLTPTWQRAA